jgi:hypothetical protein
MHDSPCLDSKLTIAPTSRLLSQKVQESYYAKIVERYLAFCTEAGDSDSLQKQFARLAVTHTSPLPQPSSSSSQPQPTATLPSTEKISQILSALRKLREGLVASHRHDHFAAQVYLFSIRLGILASSYETYYPSLLHLLRRHQHHHRQQSPTTITTHPSSTTDTNSSNTTFPLTSVEQTEVTTYLILDTACRRGDLAEAYALRHRHHQQHHHHSTSATASETKLKSILDALTTDNWVAWRRLKKQVDLYQVKLMDFAEHRVRSHTLKAFGRAYLSVLLGVLEEQTGCQWAELRSGFGVGWELEGDGTNGNGRVVIRRVQGQGGQSQGKGLATQVQGQGK